MTTRAAFDEAREAMSSMDTLLKKGLGKPGAQPLAEFIGGGYEQAIEYTRVERPKYVAEVGKRDGNYVYHFWPRTADLLPTFGDKLGDAMLASFKYPERIAAKHDEVWRCFQGDVGTTTTSTQPLCRYWGEAGDFESGHCPECGSQNVGVSMSSWAVRVTGYADNPLADDLATSIFSTLDRILETP